jgi:hypothetical protein
MEFSLCKTVILYVHFIISLGMATLLPASAGNFRAFEDFSVQKKLMELQGKKTNSAFLVDA